MKKFLLLFLVQCAFTVSFAQENKQLTTADSLLEEIRQKSWYFKNVQGQIDYNNGVLVLNGVNIELSKTEIGYQITEDGVDHIIYFLSENGKEQFEFTSNGNTVFRTSNLLHMVRTEEQAAEMIVLLTLLKAVS